MKNTLFRVLFMCLLVGLLNLSVFSQTTDFTFQGNLNDNSLPADGSYDFEFALFDSLSGGNQIGSTNTRTNVPVSGGNFSVQLGFGAAFPGNNRYLEIRVRQSGALSAKDAPGGGYTTLSPRQLITSAPYAINAAQLGGISAGQYVLTTDPRLTNERPPTAGSSNYIQNRTTEQSSSDFYISGTGRADILSANTEFRIGTRAILRAPPGRSNIFVGPSAGTPGEGGDGNSFFGSESGESITFGSRNSFFGLRTGQRNTEGRDNSFFGGDAGARTTTGSHNSFFGALSGILNETGEYNSFFGYGAGNSNLTGNNNSFFGRLAGVSNTTADDNSFFGAQAGSANSTGTKNSFFGRDAGRINSTGSSNTFAGFEAGKANTTAGNNAFFGSNAGPANTTGYNNTFIGADAGPVNIDGYGNSFIGRNSGFVNTSGAQNTFVGTNAGAANITGNNNTVVGRSADVGASNLSYATALGAGAVVGTSNTILLGRASGSDKVRIPGFVEVLLLDTPGTTHLCRNGSNRISLCSSSLRYKSNVEDFRPGLSLIKNLRPVSFNWKDSGMPDLGLIAEEVERIEPLLVTYNQDGAAEGVKYDRLGAVLVNVVKEQQAEIDELQETVRRQQNEIDELKKERSEIDALKQILCSQNKEANICRQDQ